MSALLAPSIAEAAPTEPEVLRVATRSVPPFAELGPSGQWQGTSIELWRRVAEALEVPYEFHETTLESMLAGLQDGRYDVAVAALTVTAERERVLDFTHPYATSSLAIAVDVDEASLWLVVARSVLSWSSVELMAALAVLQLLAGALVWRFERERNPQFDPTWRGLWSGYWWATVTMTTVGYGDTAPRTVPGRVVALAWMLGSVVMISVFTASIASTMTVRRLESRIAEPDDLARVRVGVVGRTTSEAYVRAAGLDFQRYPTLDRGLAAVAADEIDAFVYDAPMLQQRVAAEWQDELDVAPLRFQRQDYAFGLPEGSPLRERINRLLPDLVQTSDVYSEPSL